MPLLPGNSLCPQTRAWMAACKAYSGNEPTRKNAYHADTLWRDLVRLNVSAKVKKLFLFLPGQFDLLAVPFVDTLATGNGVLHGYTAPDLTIDGLAGDGAASYFETQVVQHAAEDCGFTIGYLNDGQADRLCGAVHTASGSAVDLVMNWGGTVFQARLGDSTAPYSARNDAYGQPNGIAVVNRITGQLNAYHQDNYDNLNVAAFVLGPPATVCPLPMYLHGTNEDGLLTYPNAAKISVFCYHDGLIGYELSDLARALKNFRRGIGGGYY